ncbi:MAG: DJ-1 family glyoxalase III [Bradymonadales bacterium]|jgi:4-methyl-5(b-hydroxyethyl)-thiazole monophosphate biosynthesis
MKILLILANGFEEIEAVTLIDIARRAKMELSICSLHNSDTVQGSHKIELKAEIHFDEAKTKQWDAVVLPGGMGGVEAMLKSDAFLAFLKEHAKNHRRIAAICAAPMILDHCGLLEGLAFTCHPSVVQKIKTGKYVDAPSLQTPKILTGRSAGTALSFALAFVSWMLGEVPAGLRDALAI